MNAKTIRKSGKIGINFHGKMEKYKKTPDHEVKNA